MTIATITPSIDVIKKAVLDIRIFSIRLILCCKADIFYLFLPA
jgi:hypothetical protein